VTLICLCFWWCTGRYSLYCADMWTKWRVMQFDGICNVGRRWRNLFLQTAAPCAAYYPALTLCRWNCECVCLHRMYNLESRRREVSYVQWKRGSFRQSWAHLRRNRLPKHVVGGMGKGRIEVRGRLGSQWMTELKEKGRYQKLNRGSTRSHRLENSLWKRLRFCRKTNYMIIIIIIIIIIHSRMC
jgi:hypothetical protein